VSATRASSRSPATSSARRHELNCAPAPHIRYASFPDAAERLVHGLTNALPDPTANAGVIEETLQAERWRGEHICYLARMLIRRMVVLNSTHCGLRFFFSSARNQRLPLCYVPNVVPQRMTVELSTKSVIEGQQSKANGEVPTHFGGVPGAGSPSPPEACGFVLKAARVRAELLQRPMTT
jgi:hypothetical protein